MAIFIFFDTCLSFTKVLVMFSVRLGVCLHLLLVLASLRWQNSAFWVVIGSGSFGQFVGCGEPLWPFFFFFKI